MSTVEKPGQPVTRIFALYMEARIMPYTEASPPEFNLSFGFFFFFFRGNEYRFLFLSLLYFPFKLPPFLLKKKKKLRNV